MNIEYELTNCRICKGTKLIDVIKLGHQYITSRFPVYGDFSTPKTDITLCLCEKCALLQLKTTTKSSELYEYEYGYNSGISNTMRYHLKNYKEEIESKIEINKGDIIIDIGCNDCTMLHYYSSDYRRIGVDPTGTQFKHLYNESVELLPTYFTYDNIKDILGGSSVKMVSSISMFYDLPDPIQFAKDIYKVLDNDGIWTCEQSYLLSMIKTNSIDTICHEHLEYYSLHQIKYIADVSGFKIIDVKFNDCNGGSFRIYFAKKISLKYTENTILINSILNDESMLNNKETYFKFMKNCDTEVNKLKSFVKIVNKDDKKMYIYGASTKGNCLLQYANINESDIQFAVERNLKKVGKMTSTGIPIISEATMRENQPEFLLVLPWHFRDEIIIREKDYLDKGGQLVFPFPHFEIVSNKKKLLITGCDGMIAGYCKEILKNEYNLYGIGKTRKNIRNTVLKTYFDMNDSKNLEENLKVINPDIIIHLAGLSSSISTKNMCIETLNVNGMITAYLCDIIHRNKMNTVLFNASSSDMYKGHINYNIKENDTNKFHLHPYSIAKSMGHSIVEFYRNEFGLNFSNGVIFTTESKFKGDNFLLKKISKFILEKDNKTPLIIGSLESYRNILHASDVVEAIKKIIQQPQGDSYNICGDNVYKIYDLVVMLFKSSNIDIYMLDNVIFNKNDNTPLLILNSGEIPTNINGDNSKLKKLNWTPKITIEQILKEYLN